MLRFFFRLFSFISVPLACSILIMDLNSLLSVAQYYGISAPCCHHHHFKFSYHSYTIKIVFFLLLSEESTILPISARTHYFHHLGFKKIALPVTTTLCLAIFYFVPYCRWYVIIMSNKTFYILYFLLPCQIETG